MSIVDKETRKRSDKGLRCVRFILRYKNIRTNFFLSVLLFLCQSPSFVFRRKNIRACFSFSVFLFFCLSFSACDRRELTYYMESELSIHARWDECGLDGKEETYGATTLFFADGGTGSKRVLMGVRDAETVRLPEGTYHALIFNRSPDGFSSISFAGDRFEDYCAAVRHVETRTDPDTRQATRVILGTPEELAVDVVEGILVTEAMLGNYGTNTVTRAGGDTKAAEETDPSRYLVSFAPRKVTRRVNIDVHVNGINNVRSVVATIDGVAESVVLCNGQLSALNAVQQFELSDIAYDEDSPFNGTLSGEFNVFGIDTATLRTLRLNILLVDNKTVIEQTLQAQARETADGNGNLFINIDVSSPGTLPDVKPEGDPDSGFNADVGDWGDPEENEIPL